jgi:hypothetical protein
MAAGLTNRVWSLGIGGADIGIMSKTIVLIAATAFVIAAGLSSGRYTVASITRGNELGYIFVVDRFTGTARLCAPTFCRYLPMEQRELSDAEVGITAPKSN